ncbi:hypothetical protein B9Z55_027694 [Caenorhabditis nigoni]|uniref:Uncharacterized protein n=1 Tax=Caenorhabditis nigoni TaxID=1611254 RepID=A0A2G5SEY7_9PELO|nr:hypothetical protein B9Z55_027694 [Caenorhabditis nigoni]
MNRSAKAAHLRRRRLLLAGTWSDFGKDIVGSRPRSDKLPASFRPLNKQRLQIPAKIRPLSVPLLLVGSF